MLGTFEQLKSAIKIKTYSIDNIGFKLHHRITTFIFLIATILVTSRQYIGEHIKCLADKGVPENIMDSFCFFTTTFTVLKHYDANLLDMAAIPHPGVGPMPFHSNSTEDEIKRHAYYQWVPFVLFAQAIMFYLPHLLWKSIEGGKLKLLAEGLRIGVITSSDGFDINGMHITSSSERDRKFENIRRIFVERGELNRSWSKWLMFCEFLNLMNVVLQAFIIDSFLSGQFFSLGFEIMHKGLESSVDILDVVFPKVTKCTFHKYGPSGSIQAHDAMCVMALNVINEKIYAFLWFWLVFLFLCSVLTLLWRLLSLVLHNRSWAFNKLVFSATCPGKLSPAKVLTLQKYLNYTDWLFLNYLAGNMDGIMFKDLFIYLADDIDARTCNRYEKNILMDDYENENSPTSSKYSTYNDQKIA